MTVSIDQIKKATESVPAYKEKDIQESFCGQKIVWDLEFKDIQTWYPVPLEGHSENELIAHCMGPFWYPWVYFKVDLEKYPKFKLFKRHTRLRVSATISLVNGVTVILKDVKKIEILEDEINEEARVSKENNVSNTTVHVAGDYIGGDKVGRDKNLGNSEYSPLLITGPLITLAISIIIFLIYHLTGVNLKDYLPQ